MLSSFWTPLRTRWRGRQTIRAAFSELARAAQCTISGMPAEIGASPDGRRKGEGFGANFSPSLFARTKGPFSLIKSFVKPHLKRVINGGPLTLEFHSSMFTDEACIKKVAQLVKTYIDMGGHQLQLNAVNADVLRDAQRHPERHQQLVVRVWGWSAYFVDLDVEYQNHIMQRAEYSI